jgi:Na+/melibiose symporter-like transporter
MRLTPPATCVLTAIATAASVYITRSITNESVSQVNPLFAAIGGFVIPAYAFNILHKSRNKPKNPQKLVTIFTAVIVLPVLAILWIGYQSNAYKVQMATIFVVLGACAIAFIPSALKADKPDDL